MCAHERSPIQPVVLLIISRGWRYKIREGRLDVPKAAGKNNYEFYAGFIQDDGKSLTSPCPS